MNTEQDMKQITATLNILFDIRDKSLSLLNEIDCRIQHGADSNGHLEFVHTKLKQILSKENPWT